MPQPPESNRRFIPGKTGETSPLGHLESAVMDVVWVMSGPANVAEVHVALPVQPQVAYNTVKTTLGRLKGKGILSPSSRTGRGALDASLVRKGFGG